MRLGIDIRELQKSKVTGIGRYLLNLIEVASQKRSDYELFLYGNQFSRSDKFPGKCHVRIIPEGIVWWWDQIKLKNQLKRDSVDLFLSPYYKAPILANCPTIITIHDLMFLYISSRKVPWQWIYNIYFKIIARIIASKTKAIITDSIISKREIIKYLKIPEKKIKVICIGVSPQFKPADERINIEKMKGKYGIKGEYIFYLGNFKPHKNVARLVEAYNMLQEKHKNKYLLVLAGEGDKNLPKLINLAKEMKLAERILYIGSPNEDDLPLLYSAAKMFVMPSLAEGFGLPAIEAMACGTPIIVGNRGALPEVVGEAGILVNPLSSKDIHHAIKRLFNDSNLYKSLINKGLLRAHEFDYTRSAEKIIELIDSIIYQEKGRGAA